VAAFLDTVFSQVAFWSLSHVPGIMEPFSHVLVAIPWLGFRHAHTAERFVFAALFGWLYKAAMESSKFQATLGKMALSLRVVDLQGNRISFVRATGRYFAKFISVIFFVGYIMAGFTQRKQALHDLIAKTYVLRIPR
jgi:uncharacterized RDD family membrane protein YckC